MQPEDIDKLFRAKLEQHATPPPPALWFDLQEQLEPEEKKRRGGFWMYAVAAAVTLLLVAGGGWLFWQGRLSAPTGSGSAPLATRPAPAQSAGPVNSLPNPAPAATNTPATAVDEASAAETAALAANSAATSPEAEKVKTSASAQATAASRPASTHQQQPLLARTEQRAAACPAAVRPEAPDFGPAQELPKEQQAVAVQPVPAAPAPLNSAALVPTGPAVATVVPKGTIEVEVRQQAASNVLALADADDTPGRTRPSVRGVLRQVRRLAQGERPDLTEVGLPANPALTVQARVAGHTLTKTIAL